MVCGPLVHEHCLQGQLLWILTKIQYVFILHPTQPIPLKLPLSQNNVNTIQDFNPNLYRGNYMCHLLYHSKTLHFTHNVYYAFCVIIAIKSDYFPKQQEMVYHCNWDVVHLLSGISWYTLRRHTADLIGITALSSLMCISQQNHTDFVTCTTVPCLKSEWVLLHDSVLHIWQGAVLLVHQDQQVVLQKSCYSVLHQQRKVASSPQMNPTLQPKQLLSDLVKCSPQDC
jgi:hypothetical protein